MSGEMPIINEDNEDFYIHKYKLDKDSLTENEKISLGAHLLVKNIIELDIIIRERKAREGRWREERNKLSKEIPKMSGQEKEKTINRVKELKEFLKGEKNG